MRSFFRNLSTAEASAKPEDGPKTAGRRVEITVEREIVSVLHPAGDGEYRCPCCGQPVPGLQPDCSTHPGGELSLGLIDRKSKTKLLSNPTDEVK